MPPHGGDLTPDANAQVHENLPVLTAAAVGFQHAVAMVGGIIVPALIISSASSDDTNRACECFVAVQNSFHA
jgi:xanthine/uracil permease